MALLNAMKVGCLAISAEDGEGWKGHAKYSFPGALQGRTFAVMWMRKQKIGLTAIVVYLYLQPPCICMYSECIHSCFVLHYWNDFRKITPTEACLAFLLLF